MIDYRTLAFFRVLISCLIISDLFVRVGNFEVFLSSNGLIPQSVAQIWPEKYSWSLYFINESHGFSVFLIILNFIIALLLLSGYRTRLMTVLAWFFLLSVQNRTSILNSAGDDLLRLLMFWGIFLPLGAKYSVDSALTKENPGDEKTKCSGIAAAAILLQAVYPHFFGSLFKTGKEWSEEYMAMEYAFSIGNFLTPFEAEFLKNADTFLSSFGFFMFYLEKYGSVLMLSPVFLLWLRLPILLSFVFTYLGLIVMLNPGLFPPVAICSFSLFIPAGFWDFLKRQKFSRKAEGVTVFYDKDCEFCNKTVRLLSVFLILPGLKIKPAQDEQKSRKLMEKHDSWVVKTPEELFMIKTDALAYLFSRSSHLFWLSGTVRIIKNLGLGDFIYSYIARHRKEFGYFTRCFLPWRKTLPPTKLSFWANLLVSGFLTSLMVITLYINIHSLTKIRREFLPLKFAETSPGDFFMKGVGLEQNWDRLFARSFKITTWPIFTGTANDDRSFDTIQKTECGFGQSILNFPKIRKFGLSVNSNADFGCFACLLIDSSQKT